MKSHLVAALLSIAVISPAIMSAEAAAQRYDGQSGRNDRHGRVDRHDREDRHGRNDRRWQGDRDNRNWDPASSYNSGNYRERRLSRNDRVYRGRDGRAYCKRNDGTTGLVIGALGGGVLANLIGGGTLGTLAGAGGGALLGRSVDRGNVRCR
jgi:hypothetical protein